MVLAPLSGCSSVLVSGALGFDTGTLAVSDVETGVGVQAEVIGFGRSGRLGIGPSVQLVGYSSAGDADPVWLTTVEGRYRVANRFGGPGYLHIGTGLGAAWSPGLHHVAVPFQVEIGAERRVGGVSGRVGVRDRFIGLIGSGSPPFEAVNSVQLTVGIGVGL